MEWKALALFPIPRDLARCIVGTPHSEKKGTWKWTVACWDKDKNTLRCWCNDNPLNFIPTHWFEVEPIDLGIPMPQ